MSNKEMIRQVQTVWREIAYDMLEAVKRGTGEDSMSGEDVREVVADYCYGGRVKGFDKLSFEERDALLKEAIPESFWCI